MRWVVDGPATLSSGSPSRRSRAGRAITHEERHRADEHEQRPARDERRPAQPDGPALRLRAALRRGARCVARAPAGPRSRSAPAAASSATRTATATVTAAATPISVRIGMPTTDRPVRAMTTVRPAKKTALPAVPDGAADGLERVEVGVRGELRAEARQDEQGVVDRHRQADHHRQDRRRGAQLHEPGGRGDQPDADADAHQRGQQRQARGDERPEGDEQDDRRDRDADRLGCALLRERAGARRRPPRRSAPTRGRRPRRPVSVSRSASVSSIEGTA